MYHSQPYSQTYVPQAAPPPQTYPPPSYGQQPQPYQRPGYAPSGSPYGPPVGADPQLWHYFSSADVDRSGYINITELQGALVNGNFTTFDIDTVKMLMNLFGADRSGTIGFNEFTSLFKYIGEWRGVFHRFDRDRSGSIEGRELAEALRSFGLNLSPAILRLVEQKYANGPSVQLGPPPGMTFDRFIRACVMVKSLTEKFQRADTDHDGWVQLTYEQFMKMVLSAS